MVKLCGASITVASTCIQALLLKVQYFKDYKVGVSVVFSGMIFFPTYVTIPKLVPSSYRRHSTYRHGGTFDTDARFRHYLQCAFEGPMWISDQSVYS